MPWHPVVLYVANRQILNLSRERENSCAGSLHIRTIWGFLKTCFHQVVLIASVFLDSLDVGVMCASVGWLSLDRDSIDMACLGVASLAWEVLANFPADKCVFAVAVITSPKDGRHGEWWLMKSEEWRVSVFFKDAITVDTSEDAGWTPESWFRRTMTSYNQFLIWRIDEAS